MALLQNFHKYFKDHLATSAVFTSFPLSLLLLGLEALVDVKFQCPCDTLFNAKLTLLIFTAPPCFAFMVMFLLKRPFKNTNIWCCLGCICTTWQDRRRRCNTFSLCLKSFLHCLIPPLVWVLLLLYDGDYLACALTDQDGVYTYNEKWHISWCKKKENEDSPPFVILTSIVISKIACCCVVIILSIVTVLAVIVYDLCGCARLDYCRNTDSEQEHLEQRLDLSQNS